MKDGYKIKIYLTKDSFEDIAVFDDIYPNLNRIFRESAVFILDMTEDELDKSLEDVESDFAIFCNSHNIKTTAQVSVLNNMLSNRNELIKNCRSLFIMDINEQEAPKIQKENGILVLSKNNIDDNIFNQPFWRHLFIKDTAIKGNAITEWIDILKDMPWLPTNSLIISDNYLLTGSNLDDCVENIKGILDAILPSSLGVDFHILISTKHPGCSEMKRNQIIGDIKSYIQSKRDYEIKMEFIFYESLHQRKVITNYNVMVGDKGFVNFSNLKKKIIDNNPTYACTVFQNIINSIGDTEYGMASIDLESIYKISEIVKEMNVNGIKDYTKRIVGNCSKNKTINNRLLAARV